MAHGKFDEDVLVLTADSWHGLEDDILPRGTSVFDGIEHSGMEEIEWTTRPLFVEVEPGMFVPFGNKQALTRLPNVFSDGYHVVDTRVVRDYEVVNNDFLAELAVELAAQTGWTFEGCGTLRHNELSFIQLRLPQDYYAGGRDYERHDIRFLYGDDKRGGSGFAGINYTRVQCMNTFFAAISENSILRVSHRDDPHTRWKLINAQAAEVLRVLQVQNEMLDVFYFKPVSPDDVQWFLEQTFPLPPKPGIAIEAEQILDLQMNGELDEGIDVSTILARGEQAKRRHANDTDLILRRRHEVEAAYAKHNARYPDSAQTLYALFNALTYTANHGQTYRGDAQTGILFGGKRAQDINAGYDVLSELLES